MFAVPFPPLIAGGDGLEKPPSQPDALRARMADVYGVAAENVLPVRGLYHGLALILRKIASEGAGNVAAAKSPEFERIARISGLSLAAEPDLATGAIVTASPSSEDGRVLGVEDATALAKRLGSSIVVVDESLIEFTGGASLVRVAAVADNIVVVRNLATTYGLAGDPVGALIAQPTLIAALAAFLEPEALSAPAQAKALAVLDPSRAAAYERRFALIRAERERLFESLRNAPSVGSVAASDGPFVFVTPRDPDAASQQIRRHSVQGAWRGAVFRIFVGDPVANDRAIAAFGGQSPARASRRAEVVRQTLETRIVAAVDLGAEGGSSINTGVGFFDHMLAQIAAHGGFSLTLSCDGDLEVDAHHTIEDCALALGEALKVALGARRGISRYGFVLPMDEAEAKVSIDLGGRPYLVFEGEFSAPLIGAYPVEMTEHVFRSLAQTLGASIHVSVSGENDHHKTEACFKALGRALRQAIRIEDESLPSTKGVIS